MLRTNHLLAATISFLFFQSAAQACDEAHSDCLNLPLYSSIEECDKAIAINKNDVHAWLDRAVLESKKGLDEAAAADFDEAGRIMAMAKQPIKIAKSAK
jgi:hypothetical protein